MLPQLNILARIQITVKSTVLCHIRIKIVTDVVINITHKDSQFKISSL